VVVDAGIRLKYATRSVTSSARSTASGPARRTVTAGGSPSSSSSPGPKRRRLPSAARSHSPAIDQARNASSPAVAVPETT
jgi:hypothetical protein